MHDSSRNVDKRCSFNVNSVRIISYVISKAMNTLILPHILRGARPRLVNALSHRSLSQATASIQKGADHKSTQVRCVIAGAPSHLVFIDQKSASSLLDRNFGPETVVTDLTLYRRGSCHFARSKHGFSLRSMSGIMLC